MRASRCRRSCSSHGARRRHEPVSRALEGQSCRRMPWRPSRSSSGDRRRGHLAPNALRERLDPCSGARRDERGQAGSRPFQAAPPRQSCIPSAAPDECTHRHWPSAWPRLLHAPSVRSRGDLPQPRPPPGRRARPPPRTMLPYIRTPRTGSAWRCRGRRSDPRSMFLHTLAPRTPSSQHAGRHPDRIPGAVLSPWLPTLLSCRQANKILDLLLQGS